MCGSVCGFLPARLSALAGHGAALRGGAGALRLGDAVRHRHRLHLHWRTRHCVGTGEKETQKEIMRFSTSVERTLQDKRRIKRHQILSNSKQTQLQPRDHE